MNLKRIAIYAAIGIVVGAASCGPPAHDPVGFDPPDKPIHKVVVHSDGLGWTDAGYDTFVPTGRHYRMAVGSWGGYRSRAMVHFDLGDVPKLVPLERITSVYLILPYIRVSEVMNDEYYAYGDIELTVHPLTRRFDEDRATWWKAVRKENWTQEGGDYGPAAAHVVVGDPGYQRRLITVDVTTMALDWISNPNRNYGLLIKAADEGLQPGIKEFYTSNRMDKGLTPYLEVTYKDDDGVKAYQVVFPSKDSFITTYDGKYKGSDIRGGAEYVDIGSFNGYGRRALYYFNLDPEATGIPANASVARAKLNLYYVPASRDERVYVVVHRLMAPFNETARQDELELSKYHDNVAYIDKLFERESPGYVTFYVNPLVQEWISGKYPNYGLMIKAPDESRDQSFPRFGARENADADRRPFLEIEYTLPEEPWYEKP